MKSTIRPPQWIEQPHPDNDIILSSRVRLARNLKNVPFPHSANGEQRIAVAEKLQNVILSNSLFKEHRWADLGQLPLIERQMLVEEHLISPNFSLEVSAGRALTYNITKSESLMINEEDHIRLQTVEPGLNIKNCWARANLLDDALESELEFAFSPEFGYKTTCPTNHGTALRVSIMAHLPAHGYTDNLKNLADYVANIGLSVRGVFGEGTDAAGHVVQVSNQSSQGLSEEEIIDKVHRIAGTIIEQEKNLRERMLIDAGPKVEDRIWRDFGTLKNARFLSFEEFNECFSLVRMGVQMGFLPPIPPEVLTRLMLFVRPVYLQMIFEPGDSEDHLNWRRAELVRDTLGKF